MDAGIFHDAHEVYARQKGADVWVWIATFHSRNAAIAYTLTPAIPVTAETEIRPV